VPVIRLGALSVKEISERNLFPVGQFYLRTFEPLTKKNIQSFQKAARGLLTELRLAVEQGVVPYHIGAQMHESIIQTLENTISKAGLEVELDMTNVSETLLWIDYGEVFEKSRERDKAEGLAEGMAEGQAKGLVEGRAKRDMEIALRMFERHNTADSLDDAVQLLHDLGIPDGIIEAARSQHENIINLQ
jgi:hypothetical protein